LTGAAPWSNGHDTWPTPRTTMLRMVPGFDSIRDHWGE